MQYGSEPLQRLGKVPVAGDHYDPGSSIVQPIHQGIGQLAFEIDIDESQIWIAFCRQTARRLCRGYGPGNMHSQLLERQPQRIGYLPSVLDDEHAHTVQTR